MSSSMTSSNPTFNESVLPTNKAVIFGNSLVNFTNKIIKYNINRSLNNGTARVKYFPGALIQVYKIILLKWQLFT